MSGARLCIFKALWFCAALEGHTSAMAVLRGLGRSLCQDADINPRARHVCVCVMGTVIECVMRVA